MALVSLLATIRCRGAIELSPLARSSIRTRVFLVTGPSAPLKLVLGSGLSPSTWIAMSECNGTAPRLGETLLEIEPQISPRLFRRFNRVDDASSVPS